MPLAHTIHTITLANGAKGLLIDVPGATTVDYEFNFRGGYLYTNGAPYEIPHLLEHLLFGVSQEFPTKSAFYKEVTKNAAFMNAYTNHEAIMHVGDAAADDWLRVLTLRSLALTRPLFAAENVVSEQGNVREEMTRNLTNMERLAGEEALARLGVDVLTSRQRLERLETAITSDELRRHYEATHTTNNLRFLIAGDSHRYRQEVIDALEAWQLPAGERVIPASVTLQAGRRYAHVHEGTAKSAWVSIAFAIPRSLNDVERLAMRMMMRMLSSGMTSRILSQAREKGICYQMQSYIETYGDATVWMIKMPVSVNNLAEMLELTAAHIRRFIDEGLTSDELRDQLNYTRGLWQKSGQTTAELLAIYRTAFVGDEAVRPYADQLAVFDKITAGQLVGLAREFVDGRHSALAVVTTSTDATLDTLGDIFHTRLDGVH